MIEEGGSLESNPEILDDIVEDFTEQLRAGKHPAIEDYQQQHPNLSDEIEDLLASVAMIEQLKNAASLTPSPNQKSLNEVSKLVQIANYDIKREIGRGGMGVVFEAMHKSLGRQVAIKVMPTPLVNSEKYIKRFKREAKAAAKLHHTNIVGVFEVGDGEQYHYYVMDFVDGQGLNEIVRELSNVRLPAKPNVEKAPVTEIDLSSKIQENSKSDHAENRKKAIDQQHFAQPPTSINNPKHFRWAARIGASLADALSYAHDANILHRDIKPSNMILDRKGTVWITDFGLAKDISGEINLTKTGDVIGTPQYLAPESLEGSYDQRSEVYCLGLTLYELATLQPAYKAGSTAEVIRAIATTQPLSPKKVNRKVPIDLSTIIEKAIQRNPNSRYQSAEALNNDLLAYIQDRPISARRQSTTEEVIKWCKRKPLEACLSLATGLLLVTVAISASLAQYHAKERASLEELETARLSMRSSELEHQRDKAKSSIEITLAAFDGMFQQIVSKKSSSELGELEFDSFEELSKIKTFVTRKDTIYLETLLKSYSQLADRNNDNGVLLEKAARAFRRSANIYKLVGENDKAALAYKTAIDLYIQVFDDSLHTKQTLISLAKTNGEYMLLDCNSSEASKQCERTLKFLENLSIVQSDPSLSLEFCKLLNSHAFCLAINIANQSNEGSQDSSDPQPQASNQNAISQSRKALEIASSLLINSPNDPELKTVQANCHSSMAAALKQDDLKLATQHRDQAIEQFYSLIENGASDTNIQYRLAIACALIFDTDTDERKRVLIQRSVVLADKLQRQFQPVLDYRKLFGAACLRQLEVQKKEDLPRTLEILRAAVMTFDYIAANTSSKTSIPFWERIENELVKLEAQAQVKHNVKVLTAAKELLDETRKRLKN